MGIFFIEYVLVALLGNNSPIILNEHRYQSAFHCALDVQALENYGTTGGQEDLETWLEVSSIELTSTIHDFESYFGPLVEQSIPDRLSADFYQTVDEGLSDLLYIIKKIKKDNYKFKGQSVTNENKEWITSLAGKSYEIRKENIIDIMHRQASKYIDLHKANRGHKDYDFFRNPPERVKDMMKDVMFQRDYILTENVRYECLPVPSKRLTRKTIMELETNNVLQSRWPLRDTVPW